MKNMFQKIVLVMAALFSGVGVVIASDLPDCPSFGYFHNCFGIYTYEDASRYIGEWKDDKKGTDKVPSLGQVATNTLVSSRMAHIRTRYLHLVRWEK